jgi:TolB-like protein
MPFANLTGDPSKDYLGEGMAEELINTLVMVPTLKVPARTSTFVYKGRNADARQIGKDLGVGTILEGSVRSAGDRIRITAQLIDASNGLHIWSESYDQKFTDIFKLQDDLAVAIAKALQLKLAGGTPESVVQAPPTADVEAYQLYLQATAVASQSPDSQVQAVALFKKAIDRDPKFARAIAGLSWSMRGVATDRKVTDGLALKALALQPDLAIPHVTLAYNSLDEGHWVEADEHCRQAVVNGKNDPDITNAYASFLWTTGRLREATAEARAALNLAPANVGNVSWLATILQSAGNQVEALKYAQRGVEMGLPKSALGLAATFAAEARAQGRFDEAAELIVAQFASGGEDAARATTVIRLIHKALAVSRLRGAALQARKTYYQAGSVASAKMHVTTLAPCIVTVRSYVLLDAVDTAYDLANQCLDELPAGAVLRGAMANWAPEYAAFRRDPRFQAFVTRLGVMPLWAKTGPPDDCDLKSGKLTCH